MSRNTSTATARVACAANSTAYVSRGALPANQEFVNVKGAKMTIERTL